MCIAPCGWPHPLPPVPPFLLIQNLHASVQRLSFLRSAQYDIFKSVLEGLKGLKWCFFLLVYAIAFLSTELLKDLLRERPVEETGVDTIIVVDNAPKVGPDRMAKLKLVLNKVFARFGEIVTQEYPTDEEGIFKGWVWVHRR